MKTAFDAKADITAKKIDFFLSVKAAMSGKIKIESEIFIHSFVEDVLGTFHKSDSKSINAGYDIYVNADGDSMSFLGDRVEINLDCGHSFNVWIDKVGCYADKYALPFLGFMRDAAVEKGDSANADFWTSVIEYRLANHKDADFWRDILGLKTEKADETADAVTEDVKEEISPSLVVKNRPRKSIIDWDALRQDMQFAELRYFQKALKKSLMLRRFNLADNIFTLLKTLYKDYHSNIAA